LEAKNRWRCFKTIDDIGINNTILFLFRKFDGSFDAITQQDRTSHNAWCLDDCYENEMHQNVLRKVENITGIPGNNSEYWQLLQYKETQFYGNHHDYIAFHNERFQGARIMTGKLYVISVLYSMEGELFFWGRYLLTN